MVSSLEARVVVTHRTGSRRALDVGYSLIWLGYSPSIVGLFVSSSTGY